MGQRLALACGIAASVLYIAMNIFIPLQWDGYSSAAQTVSELSAIGAPTRPLWVPLGLAYAVLIIVFGWGVRASASGNRRLRIAGGLLMGSGALSLFWPPMQLRGNEFALTDALHIAFSVVALILMFLEIGYGAAALDRRFRLYSIATLVVFVVFGAMTGVDAPKLAANLPTPWIGVWERINIGAYMLWIIVFAAVMLRTRPPQAGLSRGANPE
jgi:hypothetical protein